MDDNNLHSAQSIIDRKPDVSIQTKCRSGSAKSGSQTSIILVQPSVNTTSSGILNNAVIASVYRFSAIEKWNLLYKFRFQKADDGYFLKIIGLRKADDGINLCKTGIPKLNDGYFLNIIGLRKITDGINLYKTGIPKLNDGHFLNIIGLRKAADGIILNKDGIKLARETNIVRKNPIKILLSYLIKHRGAVF